MSAPRTLRHITQGHDVPYRARKAAVAAAPTTVNKTASDGAEFFDPEALLVDLSVVSRVSALLSLLPLDVSALLPLPTIGASALLPLEVPVLLPSGISTVPPAPARGTGGAA